MRAEARSLSIAESQIWYALTPANPPRGEPGESRDKRRNKIENPHFTDT
jgi:hypothetical protein